jgi:hypothetical protein
VLAETPADDAVGVVGDADNTGDENTEVIREVDDAAAEEAVDTTDEADTDTEENTPWELAILRPPMMFPFWPGLP